MLYFIVFVHTGEWWRESEGVIWGHCTEEPRAGYQVLSTESCMWGLSSTRLVSEKYRRTTDNLHRWPPGVSSRTQNCLDMATQPTDLVGSLAAVGSVKHTPWKGQCCFGMEEEKRLVGTLWYMQPVYHLNIENTFSTLPPFRLWAGALPQQKTTNQNKGEH